jgi:hypothetical protein
MAVELISKIKQKNNGDFKLVDLSDVDYDGNGKSAKDKFDETVNDLQTEINANRYVHPTTSGNKHIPSGGSSGQYLKWAADGVAKWENIPLVCEDFPTGEDFNLDESDFMLNSVLTEDFDNSDLILENSILKSIIDDLTNRISLLEDTIKKGE